MTVVAVVVAFSAVTLAALGVIAWLVKCVLAAKDGESSQLAEATKERHLRERSEFELGQTRLALQASERRCDLIEKELRDASYRNPLGEGLDPADVDGRLRRIKERAEAKGAGDPVPAESTEAVPADIATEATNPIRLRNDPDGLEVP